MLKITRILLVLTIAGLILNACQDNTINGPQVNTSENEYTLSATNLLGTGLLPDDREVINIAPGISKKVKEKQFRQLPFLEEYGYYKGGTIQLQRGNGSNFHVYDNSFTPPDRFNWGDTVAIYMEVTRDLVTNEMVFTFGPSGSHFYPGARIKLDYNLLRDVPGAEAKLFYIDYDGRYIEQEPESINKTQRFMIIEVFHFSRYAVAYGR